MSRYHRTAPGYLANLCSRCDDHRLPSSAHGDFITRQTRTRLADSSFTIAGPAAWNTLPASVRNTHMQLSVVDLKLICSPYRTNSLCVAYAMLFRPTLCLEGAAEHRLSGALAN